MFNGLDIYTATGDTPSVGRHDFYAMAMIYTNFEPISSIEDITTS